MRESGNKGERMEKDPGELPDQVWLELERELLKKLADGMPAAGVLEALCTGMSQLMHHGERCAVHLLDNEGLRIARVISPGLEGYFRWRGPVWVGPAEGTSSAAAYLRCEIATDHLEEYLSVVDPELHAATRQWGVRSMRAIPVMSAAGAVLAVLSIYYRQPLAQGCQHARLTGWGAQIIKTVLQQERMAGSVKQTEQNFRSLINNLHDGLFIVQESIIAYVNPSMTVLTGRPEGALLGHDFNDLIDAGDAAKRLDMKTRRGRGERVSNECKVRLKLPGGEVRVMRLSESAITWNNAPATLMTLADITEHERAEDEVRRLNLELEQRVAERTRELAAANRELETFSYTVSHDLRAPVRVIDGFCTLLAEEHGAALDRPVLAHLDRIHGAARRMNEMIEALLELAKVGRDTPCVSPVDLGGMAAEVIQQLRDAQPSRQVEVDVARNTVAMGDPRLLRSVLDNLLGNAWKFTGKTANARITFGRMVKDGVPVFYVRDNGAGFDATYARKLFGVFQRLHSSHEFEGTGVGLATVQRIIERHGGRIWAESSKGQGATFYFTLPGSREGQLVKESAPESSLAEMA